MRKIIYVLTGLGLIGCSYFSPSYSKPDLSVPQKWTSQTDGVESISESLPYLAWWKKFNDSELNQYINLGLSNNMNIQVAKANLEAAQGQLLSAKLNWIPFLSIFGGDISGSSQNNLSPIGNLGSIASSGTFYAILPAYTINVFTNYTVQKQAKFNVEAAENAELSVRLAVIGQISAAYFSLLAQEQMIIQYHDLDSMLEELVQINTSLKKRGLATNISVNELRSKEQLIKGQISLAENNLQLAKNALRLLINQEPGDIVNKNKFANINPRQVIPGNMPVSIIAARPDILNAEAKLKAANEGISVASSALLPSISLNYFYAQGAGSQTFNNPAPLPTEGASNSNTQSYYAAYANWIILPSVFGQINTNKALFKGALANYKFVVNNALHEVDNSLSSNNGWNKKMIANETALEQLESAANTKKAMYRRGLLPYGIVIMAQIDQELLAIDNTQTKLQQMISLVNVYQNLGGGYKYEEESDNKVEK